MKKTVAVYIIIFMINSFQTFNCMDESKIQKKEVSLWRQKKRLKGHSDETLKKENTVSFRKSASMSDIHEQKKMQLLHPFINAVHNNNDSILEFYLKDSYFNPNVRDEDSNTAFHYAAAQKNKKVINILSRDARIDASITNKRNQTAREMFVYFDPLYPTEKEVYVRTKIFARITLDKTVEEQAQRLKNIYFSNNMTPEVLNAVVDMIKNKFLLFQTKQHGDQEIPKAALLPDYASDDFIKDMIRFRIAQYK